MRVPDDVLQLNERNILFENNVMCLGIIFYRMCDDMETPYQKDCSQGLTHVYKDLFHIQNWTFRYNYCNVDGQRVSRQRSVNNLQLRKRTQQGYATRF
jgi:hypothetical protein